MTQGEFYQPDLFEQKLPRWLHCSDDPATQGLIRLSREKAIQRAYIAPNSEKLKWLMVFDVDRPDGGAAWLDADLPQPNVIVKNGLHSRKRLGHAHIAYVLAAPVSCSPLSHQKPLRLLARIQHAMTVGMRADRAYTHYLTKTPGHERWETQWLRRRPYELNELRRALPEDLPLPKRIKASEANGLGRNVTLFDDLRQWSYRAVVRCKEEGGSHEQWRDQCLLRAQELNRFPAPLPILEVKATAKSIADWTWQHISPAGFSRLQAMRRSKRTQATEMLKNIQLEIP